MEYRMEILLVEDDEEDCRKMEEAIEKASDDFYLIGTTASAERAVRYVEECLPDAVILDLELTMGSGSGIDVLKGIKEKNFLRPPFILITTNNISVLTHRATREYGADFIMTKTQEGYSPENVLKFLKAIKGTICGRLGDKAARKIYESPENRRKILERKIIGELNAVGISAKAVGFKYLSEAIYLIINGKADKNLALIIAQKNRKTETSVERAMQNAINRAWNTEDPEVLFERYTARISSIRGVPTVNEFVYYYATKIKSEY